MSDPDIRTERLAAGRSLARDERGPFQHDRGRLQVLAPTQRDRVGQGIDATDVARRPEGHTEPLALSDGVGGRPVMLPHQDAVPIEERSRLRHPARSLAQGIAVVAAGHEADLLALGLVRRDEPQRTGDHAYLRLGEVAQRKSGVVQLVLPKAVQEVRLILVPVLGSPELRPAVRADCPTCVMPGRNSVALVQQPSSTQQRPELHVRVAVHARRRRRSVEIGVEERLEDAGIELALQVHDIERDVQLGRDPSRVVSGIERTAALLEF